MQARFCPEFEVCFLKFSKIRIFEGVMAAGIELLKPLYVFTLGKDTYIFKRLWVRVSSKQQAAYH